jgi:DNA-binding transcriptional MerR regulator
MQLTIEQLADKVNEVIAEHFKDQSESIKDGRQSSILSTRRIRDYITKGLIEKPTGNGREKWFDESHVNALVSLRLLQHNGLSEQYILSSTKIDNSDAYLDSSYMVENKKVDLTEDDLKNDAFDFLKNLQSPKSNLVDKSNIKSNFRSIDEHNKLVASSALIGSANSQSLNSLGSYAAKEVDMNLLKSFSQSQVKMKQFNEYVVDENLGVMLKVDSKLDGVLQKKLCETLKQEIINYTKGEKND